MLELSEELQLLMTILILSAKGVFCSICPLQATISILSKNMLNLLHIGKHVIIIATLGMCQNYFFLYLYTE